MMVRGGGGVKRTLHGRYRLLSPCFQFLSASCPPYNESDAGEAGEAGEGGHVPT